MASKPNVKRTGERLIRMAYVLDELSAKIRAAGHGREAESVKAAARECGAAGRSLDRRVRGQS